MEKSNLKIKKIPNHGQNPKHKTQKLMLMGCSQDKKKSNFLFVFLPTKQNRTEKGKNLPRFKISTSITKPKSINFKTK